MCVCGRVGLGEELLPHNYTPATLYNTSASTHQIKHAKSGKFDSEAAMNTVYMWYISCVYFYMHLCVNGEEQQNLSIATCCLVKQLLLQVSDNSILRT